MMHTTPQNRDNIWKLLKLTKGSRTDVGDTELPKASRLIWSLAIPHGLRSKTFLFDARMYARCKLPQERLYEEMSQLIRLSADV